MLPASLGMLHCARKEWLSAASVFAVACAFRSTGIFLSGFILWGMLVEPVLARHKVRLVARTLPDKHTFSPSHSPSSLLSRSVPCLQYTHSCCPPWQSTRSSPTYAPPTASSARTTLSLSLNLRLGPTLFMRLCALGAPRSRRRCTRTCRRGTGTRAHCCTGRRRRSRTLSWLPRRFCCCLRIRGCICAWGSFRVCGNGLTQSCLGLRNGKGNDSSPRQRRGGGLKRNIQAHPSPIPRTHLCPRPRLRPHPHLHPPP